MSELPPGQVELFRVEYSENWFYWFFEKASSTQLRTRTRVVVKGEYSSEFGLSFNGCVPELSPCPNRPCFPLRVIQTSTATEHADATA